MSTPELTNAELQALAFQEVVREYLKGKGPTKVSQQVSKQLTLLRQKGLDIEAHVRLTRGA